MATEQLDRLPALAWDGSASLRGLCYGSPPALVALTDLRAGAVLAIGMLPAAVIPLSARRADRRFVVVAGVLAAVSMLAGALLAQVPWVAVASLLALGPAGALVAGRHPHGMVVLTLGLPLVAIGLSYPGWTPAGWLALVLVGGSTYAWLVSLAWPSRPGAPRVVAAAGRGVVLEFGVALGLAGACGAGLGFALGLDHVGWVVGAALLVIRPRQELQRLRSVGRVLSVLVGSVLAIACLRAELPSAAIALLVGAALVAAAATATSRWYVTPAFSTFLVFLLLIASGEDPEQRFWERLVETAAGVLIAYAAVLAVHLVTLAHRRDGSADEPSSSGSDGEHSG